MAGVGITDLFHIIHVSETLAPLDAFYDDVFGPRRGIMDGNYSAMEKRDASLVAIARDDHTIVADPEKTFGAPFRFTTWDVPGDPRD